MPRAVEAGGAHGGGKEAVIEGDAGGWGKVNGAGREVVVIGGEGEVGSDAAVGEDDGAALQHVEAVGRGRRWRERGRFGEGD